jgi:signal transduction histidine kinase
LIFNQFYRIPRNDPWQYGGTGLRLTLVKKLSEMLGATIDVKSDRQKTAFCVKFPKPI